MAERDTPAPERGRSEDATEGSLDREPARSTGDDPSSSEKEEEKAREELLDLSDRLEEIVDGKISPRKYVVMGNLVEIQELEEDETWNYTEPRAAGTTQILTTE